MKLSCCMIVRDEEQQLRRCLDSLAGLVDELIVVDTGSVDRTRELAAGYGAQVIDHPWDGSFSSARNHSLDAATGDWILILDADERLARPEAIRQAVDGAGDIEAFCLPLVNFVGERANEEAVTSPAVRLFRRRPEYRYERALHEQIMFAIYARDPEATVAWLDAPIEHFGYLNQLVADRDKIARNLALAEQEVERYPKDAFSWYNLGQEYFRLAQWDQAVAAYQQGFPYLESLAAGYAPALVKHLVVSLLNLGRSAEAFGVASEAKAAYDRYTDLWVLCGIALMQQNDYVAAAEQFRTAYELGEAGGAFYVTDEGAGSYKAAWWLGECLVKLGRLAEAKWWFAESLTALARAGRYLPVPLGGLLRICRLERVPDERLLAHLAECVDLADPRWCEVLAVELFRAELPNLAFRLLGERTDLSAATWLTVGNAHLRAGRYDAARIAWRAVPAGDRLRPEADWQMVLTEALAGDATACAAAFDQAAAQGECELTDLYRALLAAWSGAPEVLPEMGSMPALQAHLAAVLALFLQREAYELFERTVPALGWVGTPARTQAALLGRLYSEAGLADMAIEALLLAYQAGDDSDETLRLLGLQCLRVHRYAEAEEILGVVVARQRRQGDAQVVGNAALLGYLAALSAQGKDSEAEPLWQQLTSSPGMPLEPRDTVLVT